jgi:hypothetical protein
MTWNSKLGSKNTSLSVTPSDEKSDELLAPFAADLEDRAGDLDFVRLPFPEPTMAWLGCKPLLEDIVKEMNNSTGLRS